MNILAIESSCDETSAAVIGDNCAVLSNVISSQIEFHKKYGGIVPEIASRKHVEVISPVIEEALQKAKVDYKELDAVAVTYGPGLIGSLIVGVSAAKAISYSMDIPLIGVNHLEGHIYANFIQGLEGMRKDQKGLEGIKTKKIPANPSTSLPLPTNPIFPFICLIVSGGHTSLVLVEDHGKYKTIGQTRDDAAGEAYDKIARFLNLGYPGGPVIDKLAKVGDPEAIPFKRPMMEKEFGYDFSFSGIKTAVVNYVNRHAALITIRPTCLPAGKAPPTNAIHIPDLVASFQQAVVDVLVEKTFRAAKDHNCGSIALAGGVSANTALREQLTKRGEKEKIEVHIPEFIYCTDNAAMIGAVAFHKFKAKEFSDLSLSPVASLKL
ncbi:MAG: tRNA (adenosine(37)-N6)-threonylcarbamoyltransferase complex transferase subunit TsaD [Candidatus Margulisiibacteriota bacterium]